MAAESTRFMADKLIRKPIPTTYAACRSDYTNLMNFYRNEFESFPFESDKERNDKRNSIADKLVALSAKMSELEAELEASKGGRRKRRATRKLRRRRRF